jgi:dienelactone hydrolase
MSGAGYPPEVEGFTRVDPPPDAPWSWPVYRSGVGPPVVVLHEVFGLSPDVLGFARRMADDGFTVWLPVLAGPVPSTTLVDHLDAARTICVSREIHVLRTGRTSPVAVPLRALARWVAEVHGTPGVGVVGMCLTGGFALAMATEPSVLAAVSAQPALPAAIPLTPCVRDVGLSRKDADDVRRRLAAGDVEVFVTRFSDDRISPPQRLRTIRRRLGSDGVEVDELPSADFRMGEHSVLVEAPQHYAPGTPAADRLAWTAQRVSLFLHRRLG